MKKKLIALLLALTCTFSLTACGEDKAVSKDQETVESTVETETETTESEIETEEAQNTSGVVLGGDVDANYDGFEYLYFATLMDTSNSENGKSTSLKLFIPTGDYTSVNTDRAYAENLGVEFAATLNYSIRYNSEDYTEAENLQYYMDNEFDPFYTAEYRDLEVSEVESAGEGYRAYATYCYYDEWDEEYKVVYCTYFLRELEDGSEVMVKVEIKLDEVTGKTVDLLAEIESFYGFKIEWDAAAAKNKLEQFVATADLDIKPVSTGFMMFNIPSDWDIDYSYGDYSDYSYAPGGDMASSGRVFSVSREYLGEDVGAILEQFEEVGGDYEEFAEALTGITIEGATSSSVEGFDTCLGRGIKMSAVYEIDGQTIHRDVYIAGDDNYIYAFEVTALDVYYEETTAVALEAIVNGQMSNNY